MREPRNSRKLAPGQPHQFAPLEADRSRDRRAFGVQPQGGQHADRLARAGFADDAQHLAMVDMQADAADGLAQDAAGAEGDAQVAHLEQGGMRAHLDLGSK
jgi:hypothetical protein